MKISGTRGPSTPPESVAAWPRDDGSVSVPQNSCHLCSTDQWPRGHAAMRKCTMRPCSQAAMRDLLPLEAMLFDADGLVQ